MAVNLPRRSPHLGHTRNEFRYSAFLTFRLPRDGTPLNADERSIVLMHILDGNGVFYDLFAVVVMEDHCHVLLHPRAPYDIPRIVSGIKGKTARIINARRGTAGAVWQRDWHERLIRDRKQLRPVVYYIRNNPVKAGLGNWYHDGTLWIAPEHRLSSECTAFSHLP
jgi:REP element-mobilizing transposase RayT